MNLISRGESQLLESGSLGLGQLHIGASDTICRYFLLPYLQKFHRKFPDVPIKITNASSMGCVDLLEQRRVDLIITNFPKPASESFLYSENGWLFLGCVRRQSGIF